LDLTCDRKQYLKKGFVPVAISDISSVISYSNPQLFYVLSLPSLSTTSSPILIFPVSTTFVILLVVELE
jgi:hypothetical protein